ncbi:hypothetical protein [Methylobacterium pseudosasicola]|uniref:Uncharacterized protein n=1 Tax=Methylobacterium pseudosasicola TaxID=582667 RepID=A0A1I4GKQ0_9HYPH|nr:hypothetical protein [Methylobacterium pseudosasicola]SFL30575.1 hypothetical protein SAMN05192568_100372 [Methylobacterium pseudosasicola]
MSKMLLTMVIVLAVLAIRIVLKLPLLPYRAARFLVRSLSAPA